MELSDLNSNFNNLFESSSTKDFFVNSSVDFLFDSLMCLNISFMALKVVSATFLFVYFICLKGSTCETRKNVFYFTSKALFVLEIIKF